MEAQIIQDCYREGLPLPDKIRDAPILWPGLSIFLTAFNDLTTNRYMPIGPIPWLAVNSYCDAKRIHGDQRADMLYHVGSLDRTYLTFKIAEMEANKSKAK